MASLLAPNQQAALRLKVRTVLKRSLQVYMNRLSKDKLIPELGDPVVRAPVIGKRGAGFATNGTLYGETPGPEPS